MAFWTYILRCSDGSYYTGHTDDLEKRISQHHSGTFPDCYTVSRRPLELVWANEYQDRDGAFLAERQLKGWSRAKKEALIAGDWERVRKLASRARVLRDDAEPSTSSVSASPQDEREQNKSAHAEEGLSSSRSERGEGPSRSTAPRSPVIVLVRPQLGENIGKAARAMLNFGLTELRLVAPRDGWPNPSAGPAAAGADVVLERASVHDSLAEAVGDCTHVYATTVRKRGVTKPVLTPEAAARAIHAEPGKAAIVFGPERSGLETDEVALARAIVTVPINPAFASLNLAQAVILCAYEWSKAQ
ncbi:MAG: GIY-YIG nuclease family protein, partial [Novosphingobium sp.]|nr:GIY-YIG nuclease family protein [Novosphingobium sp.]